MTDLFAYLGPATLVNEAGDELHLPNVEVVEEQDEWDDGSRRMPGLRRWHGCARLPGWPARLLDVLGGEARLVLDDGREGRCFATGFNQDSAWIVEIQGAGPCPM